MWSIGKRYRGRFGRWPGLIIRCCLCGRPVARRRVLARWKLSGDDAIKSSNCANHVRNREVQYNGDEDHIIQWSGMLNKCRTSDADEKWAANFEASALPTKQDLQATKQDLQVAFARLAWKIGGLIVVAMVSMERMFHDADAPIQSW
jgi:hypothetical protein